MNRMQQVLAILFALLTAASAASASADRTDASAIAFATEDILMAGFEDVTRIYGSADFIRCPVGSKIIRAGEVTPGAPQFLKQLTCEILQLPAGCHPPVSGAGSVDPFELHLNEAPQAIRQRLAAGARTARKKAVLVGYIYRYQQRIGTAYAAERPASVAFSLHLLRAADGRTVWQAWIDETQQALSEDLFKIKKFIKRKGKWVTANQLARSNLQQALSTFMEQK